ncbi:MAG: cobalamin-binding protein [Symploca sp. SIO2E6]|nr:cobalamin-binding protein [Symploca sp. SIO2E6]
MTNLRIICLLPSATEIVAALGLTEQIVGRSHECDYPPEILDRPICTTASINSEQDDAQIDADIIDLVQQAISIYQLKTDVLEQLQPTHIITQDQCDVCAVNFNLVEQAVGELTSSHPQLISLQPKLLPEVWTDIEQVATKLGVASQPILTQLQSRVTACQQKTQVLPDNQRPTVAAIEWLDPLMATGNWIPQLITIAGGNPLLGAWGEHSPYLEWEQLVAADPEVIIIMPCGFNLDRTQEEAQQLVQRSEWSNLQAVRNSQVYLTDGNSYFNRPGPRLVDSLEILAEILHPELFHFGYQDTGWIRW